MKYLSIITLMCLIVACSDSKTDNKPDDQADKNYDRIAPKRSSNKTYSSIIIKDSSEYLIPVSKDSVIRYYSDIAYVNQQGDTIIEMGKYQLFFEDYDTLYNFIIVKSETGFIGINRQGECIFDAFTYGDMQLDEFSEGYTRIQKNGKTGYINRMGEIVIPCIYECAERFENNQAKVALKCDHLIDRNTGDPAGTQSDTWIYIDKNGDQI